MQRKACTSHARRRHLISTSDTCAAALVCLASVRLPLLPCISISSQPVVTTWRRSDPPLTCANLQTLVTERQVRGGLANNLQTNTRHPQRRSAGLCTDQSRRAAAPGDGESEPVLSPPFELHARRNFVGAEGYVSTIKLISEAVVAIAQSCWFTLHRRLQNRPNPPRQPRPRFPPLLPAGVSWQMPPHR